MARIYADTAIIAKAKEMHEQGLTPYRIAKDLGVNYASVCGWIKKGFKLKRAKPKREFSAQDIAKIHQLYIDGVPVYIIAQRFRIANHRISAMCKGLKKAIQSGSIYPCRVCDSSVIVPAGSKSYGNVECESCGTLFEIGQLTRHAHVPIDRLAANAVDYRNLRRG